MRLQNGNLNDFSASELLDIFAIWRYVSEDYSPFDVDVTTEDPGTTVLTGSGVRVVIGGSSYDGEWRSSGPTWVIDELLLGTA